MEAAYFDKRFTLTSASMLSRTAARARVVASGERDHQVAMSHNERTAADDQAAIRFSRERRDAALYLICVAHIYGAYCQSQRRRSGLDCAPLAKPSGYGGIAKIYSP